MKHWRSILLWGGLLLALAVANQGIVQRERILSDGRVLLLELAPVDPRSLMQGDYMSLQFAAAEDIRKALRPISKTPLTSNAATGGGRVQDLPAEGIHHDGPEPRIRKDGYAVFALDPEGVGRFVRVQPAPRPIASGEIAVRYRQRNWELRIASNAWFFPEGQGERYAPAKYGELRVDADGKALLAALRGEDRKPL
jgi:uncharacterized membrane-anchored protein